ESNRGAGVVENDRGVGFGHDVPSKEVPGRALEKDSAGVVRDEVRLRGDVVAGLQQEADRSEAAVVEKAIAAEDDSFRVHEGRAGGAVREECAFQRGRLRDTRA